MKFLNEYRVKKTFLLIVETVLDFDKEKLKSSDRADTSSVTNTKILLCACRISTGVK